MKAILVIDMPENCYLCPCYCEDFDNCEVLFQKAKADNGKPAWCPLKNAPVKYSARTELCLIPPNETEFMTLWKFLKDKREIVTTEDWIVAYRQARDELKDWDFNRHVHEALKEFSDVG